LQGRTLVAALESLSVREVGQRFAHAAHFLDFLVDSHALEGLVQVEGDESGLHNTKVLRVIHAVVILVLMPVKIRDGPLDFEPEGRSLLVRLIFGQLSTQVHSLNVELKVSQRLPLVESFQPVVCVLFDLVGLGFLLERNDASIGHTFLQNFVN